MFAFTIFVLLPAGFFFAYVLVNFGAEFRRNAHLRERSGVRRIPVRPFYAASAPRRQAARVIVMNAAKKPERRDVA